MRGYVAKQVLAWIARCCVANMNGHRLQCQRQHSYIWRTVLDLLSARRLQDDEDDSCNADGSVNFDDDDFSSKAFSAEFLPMCTCVETNGPDALRALEPDPTNLEQFIEDFNAAFGKIESKEEYKCINDCESCSDNVCGILETHSRSVAELAEGNFTLDFSPTRGRSLSSLASGSPTRFSWL